LWASPAQVASVCRTPARPHGGSTARQTSCRVRAAHAWPPASSGQSRAWTARSERSVSVRAGRSTRSRGDWVAQALESHTAHPLLNTSSRTAARRRRCPTRSGWRPHTSDVLSHDIALELLLELAGDVERQLWLGRLAGLERRWRRRVREQVGLELVEKLRRGESVEAEDRETCRTEIRSACHPNLEPLCMGCRRRQDLEHKSWLRSRSGARAARRGEVGRRTLGHDSLVIDGSTKVLAETCPGFGFVHAGLDEDGREGEG
jgi:hypothetical protein